MTATCYFMTYDVGLNRADRYQQPISLVPDALFFEPPTSILFVLVGPSLFIPHSWFTPNALFKEDRSAIRGQLIQMGAAGTEDKFRPPAS